MNPPLEGTASHDHHVALDMERSGYVGDSWQSVYVCRDCPARWEGPISVAELEDVECEPKAGQGRRVA